MNELIETLRDATMIETGQFSVEAMAEDPCSLLEEPLQTLRPLAVVGSLQLTLDRDEQLPPVRCDRKRILQVIVNLVGERNEVHQEGR